MTIQIMCIFISIFTFERFRTQYAADKNTHARAHTDTNAINIVCALYFNGSTMISFVIISESNMCFSQCRNL